MLSKFLYLHLPVINGQNVGVRWDILIDREKGSVKRDSVAKTRSLQQTICGNSIRPRGELTELFSNVRWSGITEGTLHLIKNNYSWH